MRPLRRPCENEEDYWRLREFLRRVFVLNDCWERSWHVARLDYARYHGCLNGSLRLQETLFLWEADGEIAAMLMAEGGMGNAHPSVNPALQTRELEEEILKSAEEYFAEVQPDGTRRLEMWAPGKDTLRHEVLQAHGYQKGNWHEYQWRRDLTREVQKTPIPAGYTIRALADGLELLERCYASGLGFHDGDINCAVENRNDPTWYRNIQSAPLYRRDLDIVAVAQDGAIASFATFWFDDVTRSAYIEPVATVPSHQKRGLGKAVLTEGLTRLKQMGAKYAFVGGLSQPANALYQSVMGTDHEIFESWIKEWK